MTITKPTPGASLDVWGTQLNTALDDLDALGRRAFRPGLRNFRGLRPVAYHCGIPGNQGGLSNGTDTLIHTKVRHGLVSGSVTAIVLVYPTGWYVNGASGELAMPNSLDLSSAIELADGTTIPAFFQGRRRFVNDLGAAYVATDPIPVTFPQGAATRHLFTRTRVSVAAGEKWSPNVTVSNSVNPGEGVQQGTGTTDLTLSGNIGTTAGYGFGPAMVLGVTDSVDDPIVVLSGDSIATGTGDSLNDRGFLSSIIRAAGIAEVKITNSGGTLLDLAAPATWRRYLPMDGASHIISEGGVNDGRGGTLTADQWIARDLAAWLREAAVGAKVIATTVTPTGTSSTDAWATTGNQTIINAAAQTARVGRNGWLRAGAPIDAITKAKVAVGTANALTIGQEGHPLAGYLEVADAVESARDSGVWKPSRTNDGLHPNVAGHEDLRVALTAPLTALIGA